MKTTEQYLLEVKTLRREHDEEYSVYAEVPDMHPSYEGIYEQFLNKYNSHSAEVCTSLSESEAWELFWLEEINKKREEEWLVKKKTLLNKYKSVLPQSVHLEERPPALQPEQVQKPKILASPKCKLPVDSSRISIVEPFTNSKQPQNTKLSNSLEDRSETVLLDSVNFSLSDFKSSIPANPTGSASANPGEASSQSHMLDILNNEEAVYNPSSSSVVAHRKPNSAIRISDIPSMNIEKQSQMKRTIQSRHIAGKSSSSPCASNSASSIKYIDVKQLLEALLSVCDNIEFLGSALKELVKVIIADNSPFNKALEIFKCDNNITLLNLCVNKIRSLLEASSLPITEKLTNALVSGEELLQFTKDPKQYKDKNQAELEAIKLRDTQNSQWNNASSTAANKYNLDLDIIAKSTEGKSSAYVVNFIKCALQAKGYADMPHDVLNKLFMDVSSIHFNMTINRDNKAKVDIPCIGQTEPFINNSSTTKTDEATKLVIPGICESASRGINNKTIPVFGHEPEIKKSIHSTELASCSSSMRMGYVSPRVIDSKTGDTKDAYEKTRHALSRQNIVLSTVYPKGQNIMHPSFTKEQTKPAHSDMNTMHQSALQQNATKNSSYFSYYDGQMHSDHQRVDSLKGTYKRINPEHIPGLGNDEQCAIPWLSEGSNIRERGYQEQSSSSSMNYFSSKDSSTNHKLPKESVIPLINVKKGAPCPVSNQIISNNSNYTQGKALDSQPHSSKENELQSSHSVNISSEQSQDLSVNKVYKHCVTQGSSTHLPDASQLYSHHNKVSSPTAMTVNKCNNPQPSIMTNITSTASSSCSQSNDNSRTWFVKKVKDIIDCPILTLDLFNKKLATILIGKPTDYKFSKSDLSLVKELQSLGSLNVNEKMFISMLKDKFSAL